NAPHRPAESARGRFAFDSPAPLTGFSPVVSKPQQVEGARPVTSVRVFITRRGRRWLETNETRLLRVDGQAVLREALRNDFHHTTGVSLITKANREVIRIANQKGRSTQTGFDFPLKPQIQHIVQEDVGKKR